jgi:hypothetical protein
MHHMKLGSQVTINIVVIIKVKFTLKLCVMDTDVDCVTVLVNQLAGYEQLQFLQP